MGKNTGKVREFCQSGKVGTLLLGRMNGLVVYWYEGVQIISIVACDKGKRRYFVPFRFHLMPVFYLICLTVF